MILFFRKLRQQFLAQGQVTRYLAYAIGEIVLVVIGILIALAVNNSNEARKDRALELTFLKGFRLDLQANLQELDRVIDKSRETSMAADSLLQSCNGRIAPVAPQKFADLVMALPGYTLFLSADGSVEDLVGSGKLEVLADSRIRTAVATWQSGLKLMRAWESTGEKSVQDMLHYLERSVPLYALEDAGYVMDPELRGRLCQDMQFLNLVDGRVMVLEELNAQYRNKKQEVAVLLAWLDARIGDLEP